MTSTIAPQVKHKTFTYATDLEWLQARQGKLCSGSKPVLDVSSPPEFKGIPGVWTPEDLFVASAEICAMSTFLSFGGRKNIPLISYRSSAEGVLEFVDGRYRFTKVRISLPSSSVKPVLVSLNLASTVPIDRACGFLTSFVTANVSGPMTL